MALPHTVTVDLLAPRLGAKAEDPEVARVLGVAVDLLTDATLVTYRVIPGSVADELVYRVARAVWESRRPANAGGQLTQVDGQAAVRPARDPLAPAAGILARYVVPL